MCCTCNVVRSAENCYLKLLSKNEVVAFYSSYYTRILRSSGYGVALDELLLGGPGVVAGGGAAAAAASCTAARAAAVMAATAARVALAATAMPIDLIDLHSVAGWGARMWPPSLTMPMPQRVTDALEAEAG